MEKKLRALVQMPVEAIEFAAHGGTNFSKLELLRSSETQLEVFNSISHIGHSAEEMVACINELKTELGANFTCRQFIIFGRYTVFSGWILPDGEITGRCRIWASLRFAEICRNRIR